MNLRQQNEEDDDRFEIMKILGLGVRKAIRGKGKTEDDIADENENVFANDPKYAALMDKNIIQTTLNELRGAQEQFIIVVNGNPK